MSSPLSREAVVESHRQAASLLGVGVAFWFLATLTFRLLGSLLLPPDDSGRVAFVFVLTVPLMVMLAFAVYSLLDVEPERRLTAATLLVLPGMVLDAVAVTTLTSVFPTLTSDAGSLFGGLLLLAYAAVLFTGVVPLSYVRSDDVDETDRTADDEDEANGTADDEVADEETSLADSTQPPDHRSQADPTRDAVSED